MIWFSPKFLAAWSEQAPTFGEIFDISGDIYRAPEGTQRCTLRFERGGKGFFLKLHWGVGWREIFKNLTSLRLPILGAANEWLAIKRLEQLGVETMRLAGYGQEGRNPARQRSFVITEELENCISLEDYCRDWPQSPPDFAAKLKLIERVAEMSRHLHENGINHRDFYICHFLLQCPWDGQAESLHLHLIDLHRVQIRQQTPERWLVKDIGSLHFSSMEIGLTQRDLLRFLRVYYKRSLRQILKQEGAFLQAVQKRADALYRTRPGI
ncbi:Lipopolysaccharide core heptose(I) kinase RfaP [hydrothermal vent metagenome]|uniref:Lipopolysaccharide core heptose(I) kinase RfaP n=1 Tax=hydrothermal vent metagenome TaxID=652676 RepID=A0A3B1AP49_9ZZZZ